jgi:hypothetical protein
VPAAAGRTRINILGAYDPINNSFHKEVNRTYVNGETVCDFFSLLRERYGNKLITAVLDNARYQKCKLAMEKAE